MIKHPRETFSRAVWLLVLAGLLGGCAAVTTTPPEDGQTAAQAHAEAQAAYAAGDWALATRRYRDYLRAHADDAEAWYRLGNAEARRGELAAAETALRRSLDLAPERAQARHNLGLVQLQLGRRNVLAARRELPASDEAATETMRYLACLMELFRDRPEAPACRLPAATEETE